MRFNVPQPGVSIIRAAPQAKLDKLDAMLAQTSTSAHDAALFAEMLSLPNDGRYPATEVTPEQRRKRTLEALVSQLGALSQKSSVLMIFEDAQWTDPTSLEVFGLIIDRIRSIRVLLLVTFRPEFDAPWIGRPYVSSLALNRLVPLHSGFDSLNLNLSWPELWDRPGPFWRGPFGCEHPFDASPGRIALLLPGRGLGGQLFDTVDAAIKALGRQHADLDLHHVQPTGMLGDIAKTADSEKQNLLIALVMSPH